MAYDSFRTRVGIERYFGANIVNGKITMPGRYEGEMLWAPYFDTHANEGDSEWLYPQCQCPDTGECECQAWDYFEPSINEKDEFSPYLDGIDNIWLWVDSQGFLIVKTNETSESLRRNYHGIKD